MVRQCCPFLLGPFQQAANCKKGIGVKWNLAIPEFVLYAPATSGIGSTSLSHKAGFAETFLPEFPHAGAGFVDVKTASENCYSLQAVEAISRNKVSAQAAHVN